MDFFGAIAGWFGYVGACVARPDATCGPFLAFIALGAAAAFALALVLHAYRDAETRDAAASEERRARLRALVAQRRIRRAVAERAAGRPDFTRRFGAAV